MSHRFRKLKTIRKSSLTVIRFTKEALIFKRTIVQATKKRKPIGRISLPLVQIMPIKMLKKETQASKPKVDPER